MLAAGEVVTLHTLALSDMFTKTIVTMQYDGKEAYEKLYIYIIYFLQAC
jgi:hypothetical protein